MDGSFVWSADVVAGRQSKVSSEGDGLSGRLVTNKEWMPESILTKCAAEAVIVHVHVSAL